jgi:intracellular sulfur oxidation DsrE/DsrF family protein
MSTAPDNEASPDLAAVASGDRRAFLGKLAAGAGSLALAGSALTIPDILAAQPRAAEQAAPQSSNWLANLRGKYKQMVDAYEPNDGFPLAFAYTFLVTQTAGEPHGEVVVLRHMATPLALDHAVWKKYKIGESIKVDDPATKRPAVKNPFYKAAPGTLLVDDMGIDKLMAKGVIFGACNVALHSLSAKFAANAGVTPEVAAKEWLAGIIPGITVIPSGTWGVNRAQQAGCTYCTGGG